MLNLSLLTLYSPFSNSGHIKWMKSHVLIPVLDVGLNMNECVDSDPPGQSML